METAKPFTLDAALVFEVENFVAMHKKDYFEEHSLPWCIEEIISRGKAEILRSIKSADKARENKAAGTLINELGLTVEQAKAILAQATAEKKNGAKA
jgi:hypothetical protein